MVQLQVNVLGEATWGGPGPGVQAQVALEVAGAAEALVAHLMGMSTGISSAHWLAQDLCFPSRRPPHFPVIQTRKLPPPQDSTLAPTVSGTSEPGRPGLVSWSFYSLHDLV